MENRKTILSAVLLAVVITFSAFAQQYNPESDFEVKPTEDGKGMEITGYTGKETTVNIPPRIRNLPVTIIGRTATQNVIICPLISYTVQGYDYLIRFNIMDDIDNRLMTQIAFVRQYPGSSLKFIVE